MLTSLFVAGFGGQGAMTIGKLISKCAFAKDMHVSYTPAYGPQQRGGAANCTVVISDEPINSPVMDEFDTMIVMNQPSLEMFMDQVKPDGTLIINSTLVSEESVTRKDVKLIAVDADNLAYQIGSGKVANIIMVAVYIAASKALPIEDAKEIVLKNMAKKPEFMAMNEQAFDLGVKIAQEAEN